MGLSWDRTLRFWKPVSISACHQDLDDWPSPMQERSYCFTQSLPTSLRLRLQEDMLLRALRFMDNMLQRDAVQKSAFLKDLAGFCTQFDERVLRYQASSCRQPVQASAQITAACLPIKVLPSVQSSCRSSQEPYGGLTLATARYLPTVRARCRCCLPCSGR